MVPEQTDPYAPGRASKRANDEQLNLLADYLEVLRETADLRSGLTRDTKLELAECLALAEAALRRAHMEEQE